MTRLAATVILLMLASNAARAESENCRRSREYLLGNLGGDLMLPPQSYNELFKICSAAAVMSNVRDAYILRDGGIAVVPKQDGIAATAATLAQFCDNYPRATLRFVTRKEMQSTKSIVGIVQLSSGSSTPCKNIKGLSQGGKGTHFSANNPARSWICDGGRTRARTWDPMIKSHLLYQLSYAPGTGPERPSQEGVV